MIKQLKKWGASVIIRITPEDMEFYNLKVGDWVDISDIVKVTKSNGRSK